MLFWYFMKDTVSSILPLWVYFTLEGYHKSRFEASVAFKIFFITKSALTTKIFCIIVTSFVNFEGNISGGGKYSHANATIVQS